MIIMEMIIIVTIITNSNNNNNNSTYPFPFINLEFVQMCKFKGVSLEKICLCSKAEQDRIGKLVLDGIKKGITG